MLTASTTRSTMSWPYNPEIRQLAPEAASAAYRPQVEGDVRDPPSGGRPEDAHFPTSADDSFTTPNLSDRHTNTPATELATPFVPIRGDYPLSPSPPPEPQISGAGGVGVYQVMSPSHLSADNGEVLLPTSANPADLDGRLGVTASHPPHISREKAVIE